MVKHWLSPYQLQLNITNYTQFWLFLMIPFRLKDFINRSIFSLSVKKLLKSAPIEVQSDRVAIVIQIGEKDLLMAMLAIKSLIYYLGPTALFILDDGSLSEKSKRTLCQHFVGVTIVSIADIDTGPCPKGGTWERLKLTSEVSRHRYVFQVDSDTVTIGPIPEIVNCVAANIPFVMPASAQSSFQSLDEVSQNALKINSEHVQVLAERAFGQLTNRQGKHYIRGCSGDSGFPCGSCFWPLIERFSINMEEMLSTKWRHWGTEQIASNFVVANFPQTKVLPTEKYTLFSPDKSIKQSVHLHFYGTYRFKNGVYSRLAKQMLQQFGGQST